MRRTTAATAAGKPPPPKRKPSTKRKPRALTPQAREIRDVLILDLFLAGQTQRAIAANKQVQLGTPRVNAIIKAELARATRDHILRNENAMTIYLERMERLVQASFQHVNSGELRAIEVTRRLMADQAKIFDLADEISAGPVPPMSDNELDADEEPADELARYRAQRQVPPAQEAQ